MLFTLIAVLNFSSTVFAFNASACYRVEVFFFKVGESCISYKEDKDKILVSSFMRTVNIGSLAKRVDDKGEAVIDKDNLKPVSFKFHQEEGRFKRYQEYQFLEDKVFVRETKYKDLTDTIEKDEKKVYLSNNYADPYTAALQLLINVGNKKQGVLKLFYDDKFYNIPYTVLKEESLSISGKKYNTYKVLVKPYIQGKGLLKPRGDWILWLDKATKMPVMMSVGFIIGSVDVVIDSLK